MDSHSASLHEVDDSLVEYMKMGYLASHQVWVVEVVMALPCYLFLQYEKPRNLKAPRAWECMQGWRRFVDRLERPLFGSDEQRTMPSSSVRDDFLEWVAPAIKASGCGSVT